MRTLFAWALLSCICSQWVVGAYYLKSEYAVRVSHQMTAAEAAIGAAVAEELGLEVKVRLLDAAEVARRALGYNGFFAFSREVDGQTVYYTLERDSVEVVDHVYRADRLPNPDAPLPTTLDWQRLFPQFRGRATDLFFAIATDCEPPVRNFTYPSWSSRSGIAPPVPPPEPWG